MVTHVKYRDAGAVVPTETSIKGAPLSNAEIDGNIKSLVTTLDAHDAKLANVEGNLNFDTLPAATTPVADTDLLLLRQGSTNKKVAVSVARTEFAADAVAAANTAVAAKTAAEAARDAAQLSAGVYATTTAGLAATTSGQYFSVPSATSSEYLILYQNSSGTAVEVKRYPGAEKLDPLLGITPAGYAFAIADKHDSVAMAVSDSGVTVMSQADIKSAQAGELNISEKLTFGNVEEAVANPVGVPYSVTDSDGKMAFGIGSNGKVYAGHANITTLNDVPVAQIIAGTGSAAVALGDQYFAADIVHFPVYGQSLSTGVSVDAVLTTTQRFDNLRFSGGVRAQDAGADPAVKYASLVPLIETAKTPAEGEAAGTWMRETPVAGATDYIKELIASENGISYTDQSYQLLGSAPGMGAQSIANLSKPGALYSRLISDVQYGYNLAQAAGKTYKVLSLAWLQGESDGSTAVATYAAALNQLRIDFDADVKAITGQTDDVALISYQTVSGNARLAQLLASETYSNIYIAGPHYFLPKTDGTHFTAQSSKIFGAYLGLAYKRIVIDRFGWTPLKPTAIYKQGSIIHATFNVPSAPLTFDTATVSAQTNMGFSLVDSGGNPLTISSVSITGPNTVRVVAASAVPAGAKLRYAVATGYGNLRDSQGATKIFGGGGINYAMHNWCVAFEKTIS